MLKIFILRTIDRLLLLFVIIVGYLRRLRKKHSKVEKRNRVLFIKMSAMGDVVSLLSNVYHLSQKHPKIKITLLTTKRSNPELWKQLDIIDFKIMPTNPLNALLFLVANIKWILSFDGVVNFDQYYRVSELISLFSKKSFGFKTSRIGVFCDKTISYDHKENEKISFFRLMSLAVNEIYFTKVPICNEFILPGLSTIPTKKKIAELARKLEKGKPILAIYAGSSRNANFRRWPLNKYLKLINSLRNKWNICFIGGPDEEEISKNISTDKKIVNLINFFSLRELCWFLDKKVDLFLGNDGGLQHLFQIFLAKKWFVFLAPR